MSARTDPYKAAFEIGQVYELRWRDEDSEFWRRVRIVSDDGQSVWVKCADRIGNSFPVPRTDLRPEASVPSPHFRSQERADDPGTAIRPSRPVP